MMVITVQWLSCRLCSCTQFASVAQARWICLRCDHTIVKHIQRAINPADTTASRAAITRSGKTHSRVNSLLNDIDTTSPAPAAPEDTLSFDEKAQRRRSSRKGSLIVGSAAPGEPTKTASLTTTPELDATIQAIRASIAIADQKANASPSRPAS